MANSTSLPDYGAQRTALLANVGLGYVPIAGLVCYCLIQFDTRGGLAKLRVALSMGQARCASLHTSLRMLVFALLLRCAWMTMLAEDVFGKLTGPSCTVSPRCSGQIFHSSLNRFSALAYFLFLCRIGPCIGYAWGEAWSPPSLAWDMSLLATDGFLAALQVVVLVASWAAPTGTPYDAVYEAYQWQVSCLAGLCATWFTVYALVVVGRETHPPPPPAPSVGAWSEGSEPESRRASTISVPGSVSSFPVATVAAAVGTFKARGRSGENSRGSAEGLPLLGKAVEASRSQRKGSKSRRGAVHVPDSVRATSAWKALGVPGSSKGYCACGRGGCSAPFSLALHIPKVSVPALLTATSCLVIASLFIIRIVLFLITPLSGKPLTGAASAATYPHFFYTLPELVPPVLLLHLCMPGGLGGIRGWYEKV